MIPSDLNGGLGAPGKIVVVEGPSCTPEAAPSEGAASVEAIVEYEGKKYRLLQFGETVQRGDKCGIPKFGSSGWIDVMGSVAPGTNYPGIEKTGLNVYRQLAVPGPKCCGECNSRLEGGNFSCGEELTDGGGTFYCTRKEGHSGPHVACGPEGRHDLKVWEQDWPRYYSTEDKQGLWVMDEEEKGKFYCDVGSLVEPSNYTDKELQNNHAGCGAVRLSREAGEALKNKLFTPTRYFLENEKAVIKFVGEKGWWMVGGNGRPYPDIDKATSSFTPETFLATGMPIRGITREEAERRYRREN